MKAENIAIRENKVTKASKDHDVRRKDDCIDEITFVNKTIDDMIAQILKEKTDEISRKDFYADVFNVNQLGTENKDREKPDLAAKIEDLEKNVKAQEISRLSSHPTRVC